EDKRLEAQPLYVPNITMSDGKEHKGVVFICTMANNIYAFDADAGEKIWGPINVDPLRKPIKPGPDSHHPQKLIPSQPKPPTEIDLYGINDLWGILSTPVIDRDTNVMYVVSWSSEDGTRKKAKHFLHAIKIADGSQPHPPIELKATSSLTNPPTRFDSPSQKQRAALLLAPLRRAGSQPVKKTLFVA